MNNAEERYHRQVILPGIGSAGQEKLRNSKVLVVGAGGLGCPVLLYLATAGVGLLGIADADTVSLTNLHRQVLFGEAEIDSAKTQVAKQKLQGLNSGVHVNLYSKRVTRENVMDLAACYDIVIDCTDNFPSRYVLSDACAIIRKPLIFGAMSQFEGQIAVLNLEYEHGTATNYRDLFPDPPSEGEVLSCSEAGVLNVLAGVIGTMMAAECIKIITGIGTPLRNQLLSYNLLSHQQCIIHISPHQAGRKNMPKTAEELLVTNYELKAFESGTHEIDKEQFLMLMQDADTLLADVRESWELPVIKNYHTVQIPLATIEQHLEEFDAKNIILFCQSGQRSAFAAKLLIQKLGSEKNIVSLRNGISDLI